MARRNSPSVALRKSDLRLARDDLLDRGVFDGGQIRGSDLAALAARASLLQRGRAQQAADVVGAKRRRGSGHSFSPGKSNGNASIVLRERGGGGARRSHLIEFRQLPAIIEAVAALEAVQHGRHPPGEMLRAPDAAQADLGIAFEQFR